MSKHKLCGMTWRKCILQYQHGGCRVTNAQAWQGQSPICRSTPDSEGRLNGCSTTARDRARPVFIGQPDIVLGIIGQDLQ